MRMYCTSAFSVALPTSVVVYHMDVRPVTTSIDIGAPAVRIIYYIFIDSLTIVRDGFQD